MSIDRAVFASFAGAVILISSGLFQLHNSCWFWLTVFVGANMMQSAFTGFCPLAIVLKSLGMRLGLALNSPQANPAQLQGIPYGLQA